MTYPLPPGFGLATASCAPLRIHLWYVFHAASLRRGSPSSKPPTPTPPLRHLVRLQTICQDEPSPAACSSPVQRLAALMSSSISSPNQGKPSRVSSCALGFSSGSQRGVSMP